MKSTIISFAAACKKLKIKTALPVVTDLPKKHQKAMIAHYKLTIIAEALNDGWQPDWKNYDQGKYYPWFEVTKSGFSFVIVDYDYWNANAGSRLCFRSRELAEYAGKLFTDIYNDFLSI